MDKTSGCTIGATVCAAVAADSAFHALGVICMGAFGGALFALMKSEKTTLPDGVRTMLVRGLPSMFCSWLVAAVLSHYSQLVDVPETALLLFVSFFVAAPRELSAELRPILALIRRQPPQAKD